MFNLTKTLLIFSFIISSSFSFGAPTGRLICWDNYDQTAIVPGYLFPLNGKTIDRFGRNSFIMDFETVPTHWTWDDNGATYTYGWSVSECEDWNEFTYSKKGLNDVLKGTKKSLTVHYMTEGPDDIKQRVLRCVKLNTRNTKRPLFKFF